MTWLRNRLKGANNGYQKQATSDKEQRPNTLYLMKQQVVQTFPYVTDFVRTLLITHIVYVALWDRWQYLNEERVKCRDSGQLGTLEYIANLLDRRWKSGKTSVRTVKIRENLSEESENQGKPQWGQWKSGKTSVRTVKIRKISVSTVKIRENLSEDSENQGKPQWGQWKSGKTSVRTVKIRENLSEDSENQGKPQWGQ